ncbi:MAG: TetR/AcrR family transcriptional regulator [Gammaproteobacteria bacterium]
MKQTSEQTKRDQLLRAALELFAANGLNVPTAKVAAAAGVANGTLFNYFPTKQDLIDALYLDIKREFTGLLQDSAVHPGEDFRAASLAIWKSFVAWALANPLKHQVMNLLLNGQALSEKARNESEGMAQPFKKHLEAAIKRSEFAKELTVEDLMEVKGALATTCIASAMERKLKGKPLEKHIALVFEVYWRGVVR